MHLKSARSFALGLLSTAAFIATDTAHAVPVLTDVWYEFGFTGPGTSLTTGIGATPATDAPDGNPIVQVGAAPWTITLAAPAVLTILDLFQSVDQFEILDSGAVIGMTSVPVEGGACNSSIACALGDARYSRGTFLLGAGDHSLTGAQLAGIAGAGVFQISAAVVPEPESLALVATGLIGFGLFRRRMRGA